ncbi:HAMP domain-containing sensor histidine kinase [Bacteroides gallinaceum]|uniref:histidine kinase n=1 Tax=Bacteroides gallinaceum TaxID=1462571 RepID=A0ABT7X7G6_9BACE|nr:HAMP domain-containing sensor histidine kinase [Bacteroides gallinaceum]MDN0049980.1 HAMP domain-containing sensor histidine kinase [Bacteroides gallinaceum]MDN0067863.1 HAMP domain-containing sensor histidine kinase [Bacteroides gallinaceum]
MDKKKIKEFFADKKNRRFAGLSALTFLGLIGALALQAVWLYNTYSLIKNNVFTECNKILEVSLNKETSIIAKQLPEGTRIIGGANTDTIPQATYLYEGISQLGYQLSLHRIDSIAGRLLAQKDIDCKYSIKIVNTKDTETSIKIFPKAFITIYSAIIPIKTDLSQGIQLVLYNPLASILNRMNILLVSTLIILSFIISCIIYQIRIIARMNKIFQIREDFTYAMIHDMKTPLSSIFTALYFLHSGRLDNKPETKEKYYTIAENEVDHLLTLTNRVLTLSKLESHKLEMNREDVQLEPIVENLTVKFTAKAQKPVRFTVDLKAPMVYADKEYLEEVLSNLMDNAIKYSKPEGVDIRIRSELNEKYTVVKVHDNGLGISEADQRTIFNKYERAAAGRKKNKNRPSGFGLGLNFVQQVMHAHEGKVFVTSIEGEFTEFALLFPR